MTPLPFSLWRLPRHPESFFSLMNGFGLTLLIDVILGVLSPSKGLQVEV